MYFAVYQRERNRVRVNTTPTGTIQVVQIKEFNTKDLACIVTLNV